jgi:hypothetical protein
MGLYGRSFASKLLQDGKYAEAVAEATKAIALEEDNPEHHVDRATALVLLERNGDAVEDFRRALELEVEAQILEVDLVDDAYFSALLAAAREEAKTSVEQGCARLATYLATLPKGRHVTDVRDWSRRLKGELESTFVKRRLDD